jgi:hypothetical protein
VACPVHQPSKKTQDPQQEYGQVGVHSKKYIIHPPTMQVMPEIRLTKPTILYLSFESGARLFSFVTRSGCFINNCEKNTLEVS